MQRAFKENIGKKTIILLRHNYQIRHRLIKVG